MGDSRISSEIFVDSGPRQFLNFCNKNHIQRHIFVSTFLTYPAEPSENLKTGEKADKKNWLPKMSRIGGSCFFTYLAVKNDKETEAKVVVGRLVAARLPPKRSRVRALAWRDYLPSKRVEDKYHLLYVTIYPHTPPLIQKRSHKSPKCPPVPWPFYVSAPSIK